MITVGYSVTKQCDKFRKVPSEMYKEQYGKYAS